MGRRDRERVQRIVAGLEKPFRQSTTYIRKAVSGDPEVLADVEKRVVKATGLSKTNVNEKSVIVSCRSLRGLIKLQGVPAIRQQVQNHLPSEVRQVKASGRDPFDFYWDIDDFRSIWMKLGWNEEDLHEIIKRSLDDKDSIQR